MELIKNVIQVVANVLTNVETSLVVGVTSALKDVVYQPATMWFVKKGYLVTEILVNALIAVKMSTVGRALLAILLLAFVVMPV